MIRQFMQRSAASRAVAAFVLATAIAAGALTTTPVSTVQAHSHPPIVALPGGGLEWLSAQPYTGPCNAPPLFIHCVKFSDGYVTTARGKELSRSTYVIPAGSGLYDTYRVVEVVETTEGRIYHVLGTWAVAYVYK